jgi:peptidoglycan/LPS O-acetylase OafA/YrhL
MNSDKNLAAADLGDYLKVFACSAVMLQPILAVMLDKFALTHFQQLIIGIIYNLVKYTAPAFIFGILYSQSRAFADQEQVSFKRYYYQSWQNLFFPSLLWTSIYLLLMPQLQQKQSYHDWLTFCWQFVNGNAAPHLWYNTMMLQFIILMPFFYALMLLIKKKPKLAGPIALISLVLYLAWLAFYDFNIFHGPHQEDWYLLDRIFISFFIYAFFGIIAYLLRQDCDSMVAQHWKLAAFLLLITFFINDFELAQYGYPLKLSNSPYYKPSMTFYCFFVIVLIWAFYLYQKRQRQLLSQERFHFLAQYAYRAYLANVFWEQLSWQALERLHLGQHWPLLQLVLVYLATWFLAFAGAISFHKIWQRLRSAIVNG